MDINFDPEAFSDEYEERRQISADLARPILRPSFRAIFGRAPVAGEDYDLPLCEDEYNFLSGQGDYSDNVPVRDALDFVREREEQEMPDAW